MDSITQDILAYVVIRDWTNIDMKGEGFYGKFTNIKIQLTLALTRDMLSCWDKEQH